MKPPRHNVFAVLLGGLLLTAGTPLMAEPDWTTLLKQADEARGNLEGVAWTVALTSREQGRETELGFDVRARAFDVLAEHTHPPREKGKKLVMVNGNMWFYKPGLRKPVPISRRQKLMGNAAYGDIAATNYAEDYQVTGATEETLDGRPCYVIDLESDSAETTYDRIRYWVDKERVVAVRAEYFTVSGKKFKSATMEYKNQVKRAGEAKPFISRMVIFDELMSDDVTTMAFSAPSIRVIPDHIFNLNLLTR